MIVVQNITVEHNRFVPPTVIDDLKVGDIFETKVKFLQAISKWSIVRSVSFKPTETNMSFYTTVCGR